MSARKKPAARPGKALAPAVPVPKDKLLELRADSHALYVLLAENGQEILWDVLVRRIDRAIDRLGRIEFQSGPWLANDAMRLRALVDAVFAVETAVAHNGGLTLDQFDHEAQAAKVKEQVA